MRVLYLLCEPVCMFCLSRSAEFVIAFNRGIDAAANLLEAGLDTGVLQAKVGGLYK